MSNTMVWRSRLEAAANEYRLSAGKAARAVKAIEVLRQVLHTYSHEASGRDAPGLLEQAVAQMLEGDWRAQPKGKANWRPSWRGLSLPELFIYDVAEAASKEVLEVAWHPWLAKRITGPLSLPVKERLKQLNTYLFTQTERSQPLFPGALGRRERSLLIFGDEKALDTLPCNGWKHVSLTLADMGTVRRAPPLPYKSSGHCALPAIIVENSDVYYRLCELNEAFTRWSLVIYGAGNKVSGQAECVAQLMDNEHVEHLSYFGDLDVAGLKIAHQLRSKLLNDYDIQLQLDEWLYQKLITNHRVTAEGNANNERFEFASQCTWMPDFVLQEMKALVDTHRRLPQEGVVTQS